MKRKGTGKGIMAIGSLRYKQYTTEDALETAADSYGGLTDRCMP